MDAWSLVRLFSLFQPQEKAFGADVMRRWGDRFHWFNPRYDLSNCRVYINYHVHVCESTWKYLILMYNLAHIVQLYTICQLALAYMFLPFHFCFHSSARQVVGCYQPPAEAAVPSPGGLSAAMATLFQELLVFKTVFFGRWLSDDLFRTKQQTSANGLFFCEFCGFGMKSKDLGAIALIA